MWTLCIVLAASPVSAVAGPFPTSFDQRALLAWIVEETNVQPRDIVSLGATDVIAIEAVGPSAKPASDQVDLSIHAEVVSAAVAEAEGYLSWRGEMRVDCKRNALKVLSIHNFAKRNLQGESLAGRVGDDWVEPGMGSQLYSVVRSACDPAFPRPFNDMDPPAEVEVAEASAEPVAPPPAEEPASPQSHAKASSAVVQISAAPSADLAHLEIERVQARFVGERDLEPKVERAVVGGRTVFRARFGGFESYEDATDFCRTLKASAQDCFVRGGKG